MDKELLENRKNMILEFMGSDIYVPMKLKEMASLFLADGEKKEEFKLVIDSLAETRLKRSW